MGGGLVDQSAVTATDNWEFVVLELYFIRDVLMRRKEFVSLTISSLPPAWSWWLSTCYERYLAQGGRGLLVGVDNLRKLEPGFCLLFKDWEDPIDMRNQRWVPLILHVCVNLLLRMSWINDHSFTCLVVRNKIGVVVA